MKCQHITLRHCIFPLVKRIWCISCKYTWNEMSRDIFGCVFDHSGFYITEDSLKITCTSYITMYSIDKPIDIISNSRFQQDYTVKDNSLDCMIYMARHELYKLPRYKI
jgi:hypothetical protein